MDKHLITKYVLSIVIPFLITVGLVVTTSTLGKIIVVIAGLIGLLYLAMIWLI